MVTNIDRSLYGSESNMGKLAIASILITVGGLAATNSTATSTPKPNVPTEMPKLVGQEPEVDENLDKSDLSVLLQEEEEKLLDPTRTAIVRRDDKITFVELVRPVGVADSCDRSTLTAPVGELWTSVDGPNYVKLQDGTWVKHRSTETINDVTNTVEYVALNRECPNGVCPLRRAARVVVRAVTPNLPNTPTGGGSTGGAGAYQYRSYHRYYQYANGPNVGGGYGSVGSRMGMGIIGRIQARRANRFARRMGRWGY